jgi:hypothetical protein
MDFQRTAFRRPTRVLPTLAIVITLFLSGCGYMVGGPYDQQIHTVHVPTFTTESYRRGMEIQLTEVVQKQIQTRTPFRLAKEPEADTRLTGRIVRVGKQVLGESKFDDPRELQLRFEVAVTWEDLRTGRILAEQRVPLEPEVLRLVSESSFAPEVGQSLATGTQEALERIARQIVELMETSW